MMTTLWASNELHRLVEKSRLNRSLAGTLFSANNNPGFLDNLEVIKEDKTLFTAIVVDEDKGGEEKENRGRLLPVAFGLFNLCSKDQAYCATVIASEKVREKGGHQVKLLSDDEHNLKGITLGGNHTVWKVARNVLPPQTPMFGRAQYTLAFGEPPDGKTLEHCVIDELIDTTIGNENFNSSKNLTIDLFETVTTDEELKVSDDAGKENAKRQPTSEKWPDKAGFIVGDRFSFAEVTVEIKKLRELLSTASGNETEDVKVDQFDLVDLGPNQKPKESARNFLLLQQMLLNFDNELSSEFGRSRLAYLRYILALLGSGLVIGVAAMTSTESVQGETQKMLGYGFALPGDGHILQLYAESLNVANKILDALLGKLASDKNVSQNNEKGQQQQQTVSLFVRTCGGDRVWQLVPPLLQMASNVRRVRRLHTRSPPSLDAIHWDQVFALNIGTHLF